jgi:hypothetical protein
MFPSESVANWLLNHARSNVNENFHPKRSPQMIQDSWMGNTQGFSTRTSRTKGCSSSNASNARIRMSKS